MTWSGHVQLIRNGGKKEFVLSFERHISNIYFDKKDTNFYQ